MLPIAASMGIYQLLSGASSAAFRYLTKDKERQMLQAQFDPNTIEGRQNIDRFLQTSMVGDLGGKSSQRGNMAWQNNMARNISTLPIDLQSNFLGRVNNVSNSPENFDFISNRVSFFNNMNENKDKSSNLVVNENYSNPMPKANSQNLQEGQGQDFEWFPSGGLYTVDPYEFEESHAAKWRDSIDGAWYKNNKQT